MNNEDIEFLNPKSLRNKAEKELIARQRNNSIYKKVTDLKKLLHELQVHQIELEMQNEELRDAYEVTETALKNYTLLFELSPMGYFTLNSDGAISELNFTGADILGERRYSLINTNFKLFVSEESKPAFNSFFSKVYTSHAKESCTIDLGHKGKTLSSVYIEGVVVDDEKKCLLTVVDISKFK